MANQTLWELAFKGQKSNIINVNLGFKDTDLG